jgi:hypothetical protein
LDQPGFPSAFLQQVLEGKTGLLAKLSFHMPLRQLDARVAALSETCSELTQHLLRYQRMGEGSNPVHQRPKGSLQQFLPDNRLLGMVV